MKKPFVPFDKFERGCLPDSKSLHETMQENCNDRFAPAPESRHNSCVPYWQATGNSRCLEIGVVEIEEVDGCGHTRFRRISEPVVWEDSDETRCDEARNRIQKQQVNQCGGTRWVTTSELCCTPEWVSTNVYDCEQSMERVVQEDGCGNIRLVSTGHPVNWVGTGEVRCEPGDIYQIEQVNQCGDVRWFTVPGGCPCIPDWQPSGPERCTGEFVERQEVDGCGHTRWQPTADAVVWSDTGETRCNGGFVQNQQISQCGTTRWFTTGTPCVNSPPANMIPQKWVGEQFTGNADHTAMITLNASTGILTWEQRGFDTGSIEWVTGSFDRNDYEARISFTAAEGTGDGERRIRSGTPIDTWFDLGDTTLLTIGLKVAKVGEGAFAEETYWHDMVVQVDIRRKGESISGGCTFGPFVMAAD